MLEYTHCKFDVKKAGDEGTITGLGSHFYNVDKGADVIMPGAFEESIAEKMPAMLWQHDHTQVPGKWDSAKEVDNGLELSGTFATKTSLGHDVHELAKMGAVDGLSIGFNIPEGGAEFKDGVRVINKVDLWEVSVVTFPMNELARVTGVKSKLARGEELTERELETILRDAGFSRTMAKSIIARGYKDARRDDAQNFIDNIDSIREGLQNGT